MIRSGEGFDVSAGRFTVTGRLPPTIYVELGAAVAKVVEKRASNIADATTRTFNYFFSTSFKIVWISFAINLISASS